MSDEKNSSDRRHDSFSTDFLRNISNLIDQHIRIVKYTCYGVGFVGLVITARSIYLFRKFYRVSDIPRHFIDSNLRLNGKVTHISEEGVLHVDHCPIVTSKIFHKPGLSGDLPVHLAGVQLLDTGLPWLHKNVLHKHVWFRLLSANNMQGVDCIVHAKKNILFKMCVNQELVSQGLAKVKVVEQLPTEPLFARLLEDLVKAQAVADKKGRGVWKRPTLRQRLHQWPRDVSQSGKTFLTTKYTNIKRSLSNILKIQWKPWKHK